MYCSCSSRNDVPHGGGELKKIVGFIFHLSLGIGRYLRKLKDMGEKNVLSPLAV